MQNKTQVADTDPPPSYQEATSSHRREWKSESSEDRTMVSNRTPSGENRAMIPNGPPGGAQLMAVTEEKKDLDSQPDVTLAAWVVHEKDKAPTIHIRVQTKASLERTPLDLVCVVDISGSMGSTVVPDVKAKAQESEVMTRLDLVKHALKVIASVSNSKDHLTLVVFSDKARIVFPWTEMTETHKAKVMTQIEELQSDGKGTNLWAGLQMGLEMFRDRKPSDRFRKVFFFSDGDATIPPPGLPNTKDGYRDALNLWINKWPQQQLPCIVDTMGFSYDVRSDILYLVAKKGRGTFSFIPDASMLATVFINNMANTWSRMGQSMHCSIRTDPQASWRTMSNRPLLWGQTRYDVLHTSALLLKIKKGDYLEVKIEVIFPGSKFHLTVQEKAVHVNQLTPQMRFQNLRVNCIHDVLLIRKPSYEGPERVQGYVKRLQLLMKEVQDSSVKDPEQETLLRLMNGFLQDLQGQVMEAYSSKDMMAYSRWGKHYLHSLVWGHSDKMCINFKDPGVQPYAWEPFRHHQEELVLAWSRVPPPQVDRSGSSPLVEVVASPANMKSYYDSTGSCWEAHSWVKMENGSYRPIRQIQAGDVLWPKTKVQCVVWSQSKTPKCVWRLNPHLALTPYHPIRLDSSSSLAWIFPCQVPGAKEEWTMDPVYNLVTENRGPVTGVYGIQACTLGHGETHDLVLQHEYFGTNRVLNDLSRLPGWKQGRVELSSFHNQRHPVSQRIIGITS